MLESKLQTAIRGMVADGQTRKLSRCCLEAVGCLAFAPWTGTRPTACGAPFADLANGSAAQSIMSAVLQHKSSAIKLIDNSDAFKALWERLAAEVDGPLTKSRCHLGFAAQRFESEARPLACKAVQPARFLSTCVEIVKSRRGKAEGVHMANSLHVFGTECGLLLVACMADAMQEGLRLIRSLDRLALETEKLCAQLRDFRDVLETLFGPQGACCHASRAEGLCAGYVYKFLEHAVLIDCPGEACVIGGQGLAADSSTVEWAKAELQSWIAGVLATIEAEFPFYEVAQSFKVFNLEKNGIKHLSWATIEKNILQLCKKCGVAPAKALAEYRLTWGLAKRRASGLSVGNAAAWKAAVEGIAHGCASHRRNELARLALICGTMPLKSLAEKARDVWPSTYPAPDKDSWCAPTRAVNEGQGSELGWHWADASQSGEAPSRKLLSCKAAEEGSEGAGKGAGNEDRCLPSEAEGCFDQTAEAV